MRFQTRMAAVDVKILVFGHSDSDGSHLPDADDAWPWLLRRLLAEQGVEAEVVHKRLFASQTAVAFVERQLDVEQPEFVIIATSTFPCLVKMVSKRVRRRFGARAGAVAGKAERFVARHPGPPGSARARGMLRVRSIGRRLIGTAGDYTFDELVSSYQACFAAVARRERTQAIVIGGAAYTDAIWRLNPGSDVLEAACNEALRRSALTHHFDWVFHEELLGGRGGKASFYMADGCHTLQPAHTLLAAALAPLVLAHA